MVVRADDEPPGNRLRVGPHRASPWPSTSADETPRDGGKGRDVLFFVDNIYRYNARRANRGVRPLLRAHALGGWAYQPTLAEENGRACRSAITSDQDRAPITSIQAVTCRRTT